MNSKRLYIVLLASIGLLAIGLVGGAYEINQLLTAKAAKLTTLKAQNTALGQKQVGLAKAQKQIKQYAELERISKTIVPEDKSQAEAVREIVTIADRNEVAIASITFPDSSLGATKIGTTAPTASSSPPSSAASSAQDKKAGLSQLLPVKNIPGVYQLAITIDSGSQSPVAYDKLISFLSDLEHNRRTAQVSSLTIEPDKTNSKLFTFTLVLNEYIKP